MAVLFVICGYTQRQDLTQKNHVPWKMLLCKRARNLLEPYLFWNIVVISIHAIRMLALDHAGGVLLWSCRQLLGACYSRACLYLYGTDPNVRFFQVNGAVWFITALFSSYMIFYGSMRLMQRGTLLRKVLVILLLLLITVFLSHLPVLLPWSIDTAFLCAFFMVIGHWTRRIWLEKLSRTDLILVTIVSILIYRMLVRYDAHVNLSVRIYGSHGDLSIFTCALIGLTGTVFYVFLGYLASKIWILKKFLSFVCQCAFALMSLQFELFDIWNSYMPPCWTEDKYWAYAYGCCKVAFTLVICMALTFIVKRVQKFFKPYGRRVS